jgi:hypothetical protein
VKIALLGTGFGQAHAAVYATRPDVDEVVVFGRTPQKTMVNSCRASPPMLATNQCHRAAVRLDHHASGRSPLPEASRPVRGHLPREEELTAELLSAPAAALQQATEAPRATPDGLNNGASFNAVK